MPNVVFLHVHNTGRSIEPYGYAVPTPALRKFASEGTIYRQAFCASHIGMVLEALEDSGLAENTLIFVFADHGLQFPRHMCNLTDRGLGVFLLARYPDGSACSTVEDRMVSLLDLFPTACEVAGIPSPPWLEGRSLLRLAEDEAPLHDVLFGEINYHAAYEPARSIRTPRYKYIRRYGSHRTVVRPNSDHGLTNDFLLAQGWCEHQHDQEALYDLVFDPDETNNRAEDPGLQEIKRKFRTQLEAWMQDSQDPLLTGRTISGPAGAVANNPNDSSWHAEPHLLKP